MAFKLALSAGHYKETPGKRCLKSLDPNETREWYLNSRIAEKVEELLSKYSDCEILRLDDSTGNKNVTLATRTTNANNFGADFYLSIHHNAGINGGSGGGIVVYAYTKASTKSLEWQKELYNSLIKYTGLKGNRSTPMAKANLHEVRESKMPAVLLELGFMDSSTDVPVILTENFATKCAEAIVEVIVDKASLGKTSTTSSTTNNSSKSTVSGTASTGSESDNKTIWDFLYSKIGNAYGVAGLMGNLYAESGLRSNNLQNTYEKSLGYTDATYTSAIDNGSYTNFSSDKAGYGLAQWTYSSRKKNLLDYATSKNKSVGDLTIQLEFLYKELSESYKVVLNDLKSATSVLEASNSVLTKFERPANQGTTVQNLRAKYGQVYYDAYANKTNTSTTSNSTLKEGDIVTYNGTVHYVSSYKGSKSKTCKAGKAKVVKIVRQTSSQPYYVNLKFVSGGNSTVNGWVDPSLITK